MSAKKVLVVDDEASIREMLRLALELSEFECLEAADIHEAYRLITDESPKWSYWIGCYPAVALLSCFGVLSRQRTLRRCQLSC